MKQALPTIVVVAFLIVGGVANVADSLTSPGPLAAMALLSGLVEVTCGAALIVGYRRAG